MTTSAISLVSVDLVRGPAGNVSQTFKVLVAADITMFEGVSAPIMVPASGWTISHYAEVWTPDTVHNPVHPQRYEGRWRWAGLFTHTRTMSSSRVSAVPVAQCVAEWDLQGYAYPTTTTSPEVDSGVISVYGAVVDAWTHNSADIWIRTEAFAAGAATVEAGGIVGPFSSALPIPFTTPGRDLGAQPVTSGADGVVLLDRGGIAALSPIAGTVGGSIGTKLAGSMPGVLWVAGAGQTWTAGALDAYDAEIGCTTVPVAWDGGRTTQVQFWEPWTPPTEPPAVTPGWVIGRISV